MRDQVFDQDLQEAFPNLPPAWKEVNNVHSIETKLIKKQYKGEERTQAEKLSKERNVTKIYSDGSGNTRTLVVELGWSSEGTTKHQRSSNSLLAAGHHHSRQRPKQKVKQ